MVKIYPPHQDKIEGKPAFFRIVDESKVESMVESGWVLDLDQSYGIKPKEEVNKNGLQVEENEEQQEEVENAESPEPKRRGRPRKV